MGDNIYWNILYQNKKGSILFQFKNADSLSLAIKNSIQMENDSNKRVKEININSHLRDLMVANVISQPEDLFKFINPSMK